MQLQLVELLLVTFSRGGSWSRWAGATMCVARQLASEPESLERAIKGGFGFRRAWDGYRVNSASLGIVCCGWLLCALVCMLTLLLVGFAQS